MDAGSLDKARRALVCGGVGGRAPLVIKSARGACLTDIEGKSYIDCTSQAWTLNVGHCHPKVIDAVKAQIEDCTHARTTYDTPVKLMLAKKLLEIAPRGLGKMSFCLHGSVANEGAMKIALRNSNKRKFICLEGGFHGRTLATMDASWDAESKFGLLRDAFIRAPRAYCYRCPFGRQQDNCGHECAHGMEKVIRKHAGEACGLIMEPIQGNGGMIEFPMEFHRMIREACDRYELTLIWDEVQTAFGRVGEMFAADHYNVTPDVLVFGKAVAGGFPLAGMVFREGLKDYEPADHSFTFAHFPVSMAAALASIQVIEEEGLLKRCRSLGKKATGRLNEMKDVCGIVGEVRGPGLMIGVEIVKGKGTKKEGAEECGRIIRECLRNGVLFGCSKYAGKGNVLKVKPPLVIEDAEMEKALDVLEDSLRKVSAL